MKNPYSPGRLIVYALLAVFLGAGTSECGEKAEPAKCTHDRDGQPNCPMQTGRQEP